MSWWLGPIGEIDGGLRLEQPHERWVLPQAHGRLGAALDRIGPGGRYELLGLLDRGGQAFLWAARDHDTGAVVVVKTANPRSDDAAAAARLVREARLLELLAGEPTVMPLLDWGPGRVRGGPGHGEHETERPWLVLPHRPHLSLPEAVRLAGGPLTAGAAGRIAHDLARALRHLHGHGVVHRDLSPGNVLLTPEGVLLADLGMAWATALPEDGVEERFTTGLSVAGRGVTPGWLAPETGRRPEPGGRPDRAPAADVFCWGLHVFGALTGHHPWTSRGLGVSTETHLRMTEWAEPPDLGGLDRVPAPAALEALVRAALDLDPAARPTAAELVAALGEVPTAAVRAPGPGAIRPRAAVPPPRRRAPLRDSALLTAAGLLTAAVLCGGGAVDGALDHRRAEAASGAAGVLLPTARTLAALHDEFLASGPEDDVRRSRTRPATDAAVRSLRDALATAPASLPTARVADELGTLDRARAHVSGLAARGQLGLPGGRQQQVAITDPAFKALEALLVAATAEVARAEDDGTAGGAAYVAALTRATGAAVEEAAQLGIVLAEPRAVGEAGLLAATRRAAVQSLALADAAATGTDGDGAALELLARDDGTLRQWRDAAAEAGGGVSGPTPPAEAAERWRWFSAQRIGTMARLLAEGAERATDRTEAAASGSLRRAVLLGLGALGALAGLGVLLVAERRRGAVPDPAPAAVPPARATVAA